MVTELTATKNIGARFMGWLAREFAGKELRTYVMILVTNIVAMGFAEIPHLFPLIYGWQETIYIGLFSVPMIAFALFFIHVFAVVQDWYTRFDIGYDDEPLRWKVIITSALLYATILIPAGYTTAQCWASISSGSLRGVDTGTFVFGVFITLAYLLGTVFGIAGLVFSLHLVRLNRQAIANSKQ